MGLPAENALWTKSFVWAHFFNIMFFLLKNGMQQKDNFLCLVEMNSGYDFILVLT